MSLCFGLCDLNFYNLLYEEDADENVQELEMLNSVYILSNNKNVNLMYVYILQCWAQIYFKYNNIDTVILDFFDKYPNSSDYIELAINFNKYILNTR